jgi:non-heme Fe2+,alpha-ketoglutarate-dependent halogenase
VQETRSIAERFTDDGVVTPIDALDAAVALNHRQRLNSLEYVFGHLMGKPAAWKPHLLYKFADEIVNSPAILDRVEEIIGPDILCWSSRFFIKNPGDENFIAWHQDSAYWGLDNSEKNLTAWVALSETTIENGAMKVVPGSHKNVILPHGESTAKTMASRGQEVQVDVNENDALYALLKPGQMSIHHDRIFHGSDPNKSTDQRIGLAIRYIPTSSRQMTNMPDSALLVRGEDKYGNFNLEFRPKEDLAPESIEQHRKAYAMYNAFTDYAAQMHKQSFETSNA